MIRRAAAPAPVERVGEVQTARIVEEILERSRVQAATSLPRFLSAPSVARLLDCSTAWVRQWHKAGLLTGFVLHAVPGDRGRLVFLESDVRAFLQARGLPVGGEGAGGGAL